MGNNTVHFLKMTGTVPPGKRKEFEQTVKFVSNHLSFDCLQFSLSADIFTTDLYHFYSLWPSRESLGNFYRSQEFKLLDGAYKTLGTLESNIAGELVEIKPFKIIDMSI